MVVNDIYDINLDKIDHPTRPLPSGIITLPEATGLVCILIGAIEYL
jgi:4-hydroxybenzoate polyprenyltransferase